MTRSISRGTRAVREHVLLRGPGRARRLRAGGGQADMGMTSPAPTFLAAETPPRLSPRNFADNPRKP
eukprot:372534-Pyramimonas_sp.AAC.1